MSHCELLQCYLLSGKLALMYRSAMELRSLRTLPGSRSNYRRARD